MLVLMGVFVGLRLELTSDITHFLAAGDDARLAKLSRQLAESELIGLAPLAALLDVADHAGADRDLPTEERLAAAAGYIRLRDFSPLQALELRLAAARARDASSAAGASRHGVAR